MFILSSLLTSIFLSSLLSLLSFPPLFSSLYYFFSFTSLSHLSALLTSGLLFSPLLRLSSFFYSPLNSPHPHFSSLHYSSSCFFFRIFLYLHSPLTSLLTSLILFILISTASHVSSLTFSTCILLSLLFSHSSPLLFLRSQLLFLLFLLSLAHFFPIFSTAFILLCPLSSPCTCILLSFLLSSLLSSSATISY